MNSFPDIKKGAAMFGGGNSDFYKFEEGDNRVRILAIADEPIAKHFVAKKGVTCVGIENGCPLHGENAPMDEKSGKPRSPSIKYMAYIVDREEPNNIRLADLPYSLMKQLSDLKNDPDWSFDELPMPYSVTVKYNPDAAGTDMYKLIPSPTRVPVSAEIIEKLSHMKALDEIVHAVRDKAAADMDLHIASEPPVIKLLDETPEDLDAEMRRQDAKREAPMTDDVPF